MMNDPYRDFQIHEAEQEEKLNKLPKCIDCGQAIQDDWLFDIFGDLYCEKCLNKNFRRYTEDYEK